MKAEFKYLDGRELGFHHVFLPCDTLPSCFNPLVSLSDVFLHRTSKMAGLFGPLDFVFVVIAQLFS